MLISSRNAIFPCCVRGDHKQKRRKCPHEDCRLGDVQHVCPSWQCHRYVCALLARPSLFANLTPGINIYRTDDSPYYFRGNKVLIAIACYNLVLLVATKFFYVSVNKKRETKWSAMSKEEKEHYLATTTDRGNKRLDFRFAH